MRMLPPGYGTNELVKSADAQALRRLPGEDGLTQNQQVSALHYPGRQEQVDEEFREQFQGVLAAVRAYSKSAPWPNIRGGASQPELQDIDVPLEQADQSASPGSSPGQCSSSPTPPDKSPSPATPLEQEVENHLHSSQRRAFSFRDVDGLVSGIPSRTSVPLSQLPCKESTADDSSVVSESHHSDISVTSTKSQRGTQRSYRQRTKTDILAEQYRLRVTLRGPVRKILPKPPADSTRLQARGSQSIHQPASGQYLDTFSQPQNSVRTAGQAQPQRQPLARQLVPSQQQDVNAGGHLLGEAQRSSSLPQMHQSYSQAPTQIYHRIPHHHELNPQLGGTAPFQVHGPGINQQQAQQHIAPHMLPRGPLRTTMGCVCPGPGPHIVRVWEQLRDYTSALHRTLDTLVTMAHTEALHAVQSEHAFSMMNAQGHGLRDLIPAHAATSNGVPETYPQHATRPQAVHQSTSGVLKRRYSTPRFVHGGQSCLEVETQDQATAPASRHSCPHQDPQAVGQRALQVPQIIQPTPLQERTQSSSEASGSAKRAKHVHPRKFSVVCGPDGLRFSCAGSILSSENDGASDK